MASPDAAILQEIARISGAINRAKAAQAGNSSSTPADVTASTSSYRGRNPYHQPPPYGHNHRGAAHAYRGRGYPSAPPSSYASNGAYRGGASHSSYRGGRGSHQQQNHSVTRKNNTWTAPTPAAASTSTSATASKDGPAASSSRHKTLVLNNATTRDKSKSVSPPGTTSTPLPAVEGETEAASSGSDTITVNKTAAESDSKMDESVSSTANTEDEEKTKKAEEEDADMEDGEIDESTLPPPEPKKPPISLIKQGNEIIINGVTFVSDASGRKLVRKDSSLLNSSNSSHSSSKTDTKGKGKLVENSSVSNTEATSTPSKTSIDGQAYVRTKSGNLISTAVLKKRQEMAEKKKRINELVAVAKNVQKARQATARAQKKKTLCRFFQKTGICARANTCPYIHDSNKVSICPRYLRNSCPLSSDSCPLSHTPNAHRMPHCQHYPHCKRGDSCPYTHVQVPEDAKICKLFVGMGWCEKGDQCTERHVWECPDFEENGKCTKRGCKLGHVIRRKNAKDGSSNSTSPSGKKGDEGMPSFMFLDTNPDPAFVADKLITLPLSAAARKRSASTSVASAEDYSSGEEEAANLVKKKVKIVEMKPKDAMEANDDYVTLVFSDVDDTEEEEEDEDDGSEADSGLEEEHLDSISRQIEPIVYDDDKEEEDSEKDTDESDESSDDDEEDDANTTVKLNKPRKDVATSIAVANAAEATAGSSSSEDSDQSDEDL